MSRVLKTSGFLGLAVQMLWGMYDTYLITPGGPALQDWMIGAHAHFGVLGILAVVLGLEFLWGFRLFVSMAVMAWQAWSADAGSGSGPAAAPADD